MPRLDVSGSLQPAGQPDGELSASRWEVFRAQQQAIEAPLRRDGAAEAQLQAKAPVELGWGDAWNQIE